MKIITIPHQTLRKKAQAIKRVDAKLEKFVKELQQTLKLERNPRGVGLAAPQVNKLWRIIATQVSTQTGEEKKLGPMRAFINPIITKHSRNLVCELDPEKSRWEGCLSVPGLWGPIPRWEWLEVEYQTMVNGQLKGTSERLEKFAAVVIQHELDHLDGILFTDHSLKYDLPVYRAVGEKFVEIKDRSILEAY